MILDHVCAFIAGACLEVLRASKLWMSSTFLSSVVAARALCTRETHLCRQGVCGLWINCDVVVEGAGGQVLDAPINARDQ